MRLRSPAFADGEPIPARHTRDGEDVSPELQWSDVPEGASSLALTCADPDAPRGTFTDWLSSPAIMRRNLPVHHMDPWAAPEDHAIGGLSAGAGARWWSHDWTYRRAPRGERADGH